MDIALEIQNEVIVGDGSYTEVFLFVIQKMLRPRVKQHFVLPQQTPTKIWLRHASQMSENPVEAGNIEVTRLEVMMSYKMWYSF